MNKARTVTAGFCTTLSTLPGAVPKRYKVVSTEKPGQLVNL